MSDYEVTRLDDVDRLGNWQPLRRRLGIGAFGINAWTGDEEGAEIIGEHDEKPTGHEELYLVLEGQARFTVGGDSFDADAGTIVFVPDPELRRGAVATEPGTRILTVGAKRGEAYRAQPWEENAEIFPLFAEGRFAEAKERLEGAVAEFPDAGGPLYNLACAEALLGEHEAALEHLARAVELEPRFVALAQDDSDFASIREDPRFPRA
jgi:tetratricopeptide (TPR) repeat protein